MKNKVKEKENEFQSLIKKLLQNIAEINILFPDSRTMGDFVTVDNKQLGLIAFGISRRITSENASWILISRDEPLWNEVVAKLQDLRPNTFSTQYIEKELDNLVWKYRSAGWQVSDISTDVIELINGMSNKQIESIKLYIPIYGLIVKASSFKIGDVEFVPRFKYPKLDEQLKELEDTTKVQGSIGKIHTIAITIASGCDFDMILQNAEGKVNKALNLLRAVRYPIVTDSLLKQIGIIGTYYTLPKLYAFDASQVHQNSLSTELCDISLSGVVDIVIDDHAIQVMFENAGLNKLGDLLISAHSPFERGLLRGAELLGEATKPDTIESKFLKVALAVDSMIGDEPSKDMTDKGVRARIAERSAFLLGNIYEDRRKVYDDMRRFIDKRGGLAHGAPETISQWETNKFGSYAIKILIKLLLQAPAFRTIDDLAEWTLRESFRDSIVAVRGHEIK